MALSLQRRGSHGAVGGRVGRFDAVDARHDEEGSAHQDGVDARLQVVRRRIVDFQQLALAARDVRLHVVRADEDAVPARGELCVVDAVLERDLSAARRVGEALGRQFEGAEAALVVELHAFGQVQVELHAPVVLRVVQSHDEVAPVLGGRVGHGFEGFHLQHVLGPGNAQGGQQREAPCGDFSFHLLWRENCLWLIFS